MTEANYIIKAQPFEKEWSNANKIEVVLELKTDAETKIFRGLIDLMAIKRGVI